MCSLYPSTFLTTVSLSLCSFHTAPVLQLYPTASAFPLSSVRTRQQLCIIPHVCASSRSGDGQRLPPSNRPLKFLPQSVLHPKLCLFYLTPYTLVMLWFPIATRFSRFCVCVFWWQIRFWLIPSETTKTIASYHLHRNCKKST